VKNQETTACHVRVERRHIAFLRFILEAYDGIGVLTTTDAGRGLVCLHIVPGAMETVASLLADLRRQMLIEPVVLPPQAGTAKSHQPAWRGAL